MTNTTGKTNTNNAYFFVFDGKKLKRAIAKVNRTFPEIDNVWEYSGTEGEGKISMFKDVKDITHLFKTK